ncbi:MAG TPA: hypothetical protein VL860_05575, partial [Planctomycetota bacterium]|nr:hypothetical protein [Planctomycetota bacterium]
MSRGAGFRGFSVWVGQTVIKTSLLVAVTLIASAAIGFTLFSTASAGSIATSTTPGKKAPATLSPASAIQTSSPASPNPPATTAAPLSFATEPTERHDPVGGAPTFRVTLTDTTNLSGTFRDGETIFVPPTCKMDIRNLAEGTPASFAPSAAFANSQSKQTLDAPDHAIFQIAAKSGDEFQLRYGPTAKLNVLVLYPAKRTVAKSGDVSIRVNDTVLGTLKDPHKCGSKLVKEHVDCFIVPGFFARITDANRDWMVTPHLKLGQMVAPATRWVNNKKVFTNERHTEYFAPNRPLIEKLELVAEELERQGIHFDTW